jgi:hypothetical protein
MRTCPSCKTEKEHGAFYRNRATSHGLSAYCIECERSRQKGDAHRRVKPSAEQKRRWQIKTRYGLSQEAFDNLIAAQASRCGICEKELSVSGERNTWPYVDHDHVSGAVRGILCHACNIRIGGWDSPDFRSRAMKWLKL